MREPDDHWAEGTAYEAFMGRWSQAVARDFIRWLDPQTGLDWLDIGCGTGALTRAIAQTASPRSVTACDPSKAFIEYANAHNGDSRLSFEVAGFEDLPRTPDGYGALVSGLVLNFIARPVDAIYAMLLRAATHGIVAAYVWDYAGRMDFLRSFWDAAVELDPEAKKLDEGRRFPLCRPENLESAFREAGLTQVRTAAIEIPVIFTTFEDYWEPFLAGTGPAPSYVTSLDDEWRDRLAENLEQRLIPDANGEIKMIARAWAVRGERG